MPNTSATVQTDQNTSATQQQVTSTTQVSNGVTSTTSTMVTAPVQAQPQQITIQGSGGQQFNVINSGLGQHIGQVGLIDVFSLLSVSFSALVKASKGEIIWIILAKQNPKGSPSQQLTRVIVDLDYLCKIL